MDVKQHAQSISIGPVQQEIHSLQGSLNATVGVRPVGHIHKVSNGQSQAIDSATLFELSDDIFRQP